MSDSEIYFALVKTEDDLYGLALDTAVNLGQPIDLVQHALLTARPLSLDPYPPRNSL